MKQANPSTRRSILLFVLAVVLPIAWLFRDSLDPRLVLFSNDGPLGAMMPEAKSILSTFTGLWRPLNWIGTQDASSQVDLTMGLFVAFRSPVAFAKFYAPLALLFLGFGAWFFARRSGFRPAVAALVGTAAALASNPVSYACWGLPPKAISLGFTLLALGLVAGPTASGPSAWARVALAGFCVGLNVAEGADVGAILSLYVAASIAWNALSSPGGTPARVASGTIRLGVVALAAAWIAAHSLSSLIGTQIKGVAGLEAAKESRDRRWEFATFGSLPPMETLRIVVPGLFGYRMDTPDGGAYWGGVGADGTPQTRMSGSGEYVGVLVVLGAALAMAQSVRRQGSPFTEAERRTVWFWSAATVVSLLLAYGKFAPFYRIFFSLPYATTIRFPMKFLHGMNLSLWILFAHGLEALARSRLDTARATGRPGWLGALPRAEARFVMGMIAATVLAILAAIVFSEYRPSLDRYLASIPFPSGAAATASFGILEAWIAVLFLGASAGLLGLAFAGKFAGDSGVRRFWILAGMLLVIDMARSNTPWVRHYDYQRRYHANPVVDFLAAKPHESRVAFRLLPQDREQLLLPPTDGIMPAVHNLWLEHHFQYYGVQTADIIQAPRIQALDDAFMNHFRPRDTEARSGDLSCVARLWQLTSTRYLVGARNFEGQVNGAFARGKPEFVPRLGFDLGLRADANTNHLAPDDFEAVANPSGRYAVFEYMAALPRASLFARWETTTHDAATLARLRDPAFDPSAIVLLDAGPPAPSTPTATNGIAMIQSYESRRVVIATRSETPAVLLLNDRWHPDWRATVDGKDAPVLRANHIMRAVAVPAGAHTVEFRFAPDARPLWASLSAVGAAVLLVGYLAANARRNSTATS